MFYSVHRRRPLGSTRAVRGDAQPGRVALMTFSPAHAVRRVMHCDLDCFFAAVEELDDPTLAGRPVVVGGDPERRGVVSTANYHARRFGIHSAMSAAVARRLCHSAALLRLCFESYH